MPYIDQDSVVKITSSQKISNGDQNTNFGTGFVIHRDGEAVYILTCAHVVDAVGGSKHVLVEDEQAERIDETGHSDNLDIAILSVDINLNNFSELKPLLLLPSELRQTREWEGLKIEIYGFQELDPKASISRPTLLRLDGRLRKFVQQSPSGFSRQKRIGTWILDIEDIDKLEHGYSGSPVYAPIFGRVVGFAVFNRQKGESGYAIEIGELLKIKNEKIPEALVRIIDNLSAELHEIVKKLSFQENDIEGFCSELKIETKYLVSKEINDRVLEILYYTYNKGEIVNFVDALRKKRPDIIFRGSKIDTIISKIEENTYDVELSPKAISPKGISLKDFLETKGLQLEEDESFFTIKAEAEGDKVASWFISNVLWSTEENVDFSELIKFNSTILFASNGLGKTTHRMEVARHLRKNRKNIVVEMTDFDVKTIEKIALVDYRRVVTEKVLSQLKKSINVQEEPVAMEKRPQVRVDTAELRQMLTKYFDEGELHTLCSDLNIDYESLPAQGKENKARELVAYTERHGRTSELMARCRSLRPNVDWQKIVLSVPPERLQKLPPGQKKHLGGIKSDQESMEKLAALCRFARIPWEKSYFSSLDESAVSKKLDEYENDSMVFTSWISALSSIVDVMGFKGICLLVDRVNEWPYTQGNPTKIQELLEPMLSSGTLLPESSKFACKFFLDQGLQSVLENKIRECTGALKVYEIKWETDSFIQMLDRRIDRYSPADSGVHEFLDFFEEGVTKEDFNEFINLAGGSPRALIELVEHLFRFHCQRTNNRDEDINRQTIRDFVDAWKRKQ